MWAGDKSGQIGGISCFLVDTDTSGLQVGDIHRLKGHVWVAPAKLQFENNHVGDDALLGAEGKGVYRYAV